MGLATRACLTTARDTSAADTSAAHEHLLQDTTEMQCSQLLTGSCSLPTAMYAVHHVSLVDAYVTWKSDQASRTSPAHWPLGEVPPTDAATAPNAVPITLAVATSAVRLNRPKRLAMAILFFPKPCLPSACNISMYCLLCIPSNLLSTIAQTL